MVRAMRRPRVRIGTLMLLIMIAALVTGFAVQHFRHSYAVGRLNERISSLTSASYSQSPRTSVRVVGDHILIAAAGKVAHKFGGRIHWIVRLSNFSGPRKPIFEEGYPEAPSIRPSEYAYSTLTAVIPDVPPGEYWLEIEFQLVEMGSGTKRRRVLGGGGSHAKLTIDPPE